MPVIRVSDEVVRRLKAIDETPGRALAKVLDVVEADRTCEFLHKVKDILYTDRDGLLDRYHDAFPDLASLKLNVREMQTDLIVALVTRTPPVLRKPK